MKKVLLGIAIPLVALSLAACGNDSQQSSNTASSNASSASVNNGSSASSQTSSTDDLNADDLTPAQTAALVLYYGDAHRPGSDKNDYSANMAKAGQSATVKIYNKDDVPENVGLLYKSYPAGAQLLYTIKLSTGSDHQRLNSIYYTIANDKIYFADSDAGINAEGVTTAEMVAYAKKHGGVERINNVARHTKIVDMRNKSSQSTSNHRQTDLTTQQLGTLVALYKSPDWFKDGVKGGDLYYADSAGKDFKDLSGYSYVTANGDPTSYIYFKRNGNDVTVKTVEPQGDQTVAEAPMVTKHITVSGLIRDYYTSQSQKDEVNGYADQLKPQSEYEADHQ